MRILQINSRVNKGSASRITEMLGQQVIANGWESYIAYGRPSNPSKSNLIQIGSFNGVKFHYLMSNLTGKHGLYSICATNKLVRRIKEISPDVIHLQNIHGYYINYKVLFEYLNTTNIPIVWTLHDCWAFTGHCAHFVSAKCEKWKTGCYQCPLKKAYPGSLFFDRSKKDYELKKRLFAQNKNMHIVPVSHWLEGLVLQSFLKGCDIRVIHNGIDLDIYKPCEKKQNEKIEILGVASIWTKGKGLYDFYKLRTLLDYEQYGITLVGLNDEQLKNLPKGIKGVKRTDTIQDLAKLYGQSDVFVNLTYADTFPTVNLESIACGTPVITYQTGGSPETIDERTGVVVAQGDISSVVSAIYSIGAMSYEQRIKQREVCVNRAHDMFEKNDRYNDYINLYKELCGLKN